MKNLICANALDILPTLDKGSFDALVTDPPYSSGGLHTQAKSLPTSAKYQNSGTKKKYPGGDFPGDGLDQRSWLRWCTEWLRESLRVVRPGGYALVFIDWRQLPTMTDAFQMSGWTWRGIVVWNKTGSARAAHKGYFRHQSEFIVWGTNGRCEKATHGGPFPGVYTHRVNPAEKLHVTGKPIALMKELVDCTPPASRILDPFCGSGTTIKAAIETGRNGLGIELSPDCFAVAEQNLSKALK